MTNSEEKESITPQERSTYRPCLVVLAGLPISGKSTIGNELAKRTNIVFLDSDLARLEVFGESRARLDDLGELFAMQTAYQRNHEKARDISLEGRPVAVAATYSRELYHEMIKDLASRMNVPMKFFLLDPDLSQEEVKARIKGRIEEEAGNLSNMRSYDHFLSIKKRYMVIPDVDVTRINTKLPVEVCIKQIQENLQDLRQNSY